MKQREIDTASRFELLDQLQALENDLQAVPGTTNIDFDLSGIYDHCPLCFVVGYNIQRGGPFIPLPILSEGWGIKQYHHRLPWVSGAGFFCPSDHPTLADMSLYSQPASRRRLIRVSGNGFPDYFQPPTHGRPAGLLGINTRVGGGLRHLHQV